MNRILLALGIPLIAIQLSSCAGTVDVKHPTVAQQDQLDVQWGLPPRQVKGGAKRLYATPDGQSATAVETAPEPAAPAALPTPPPAP
jgi:hypothetical protein